MLSDIHREVKTYKLVVKKHLASNGHQYAPYDMHQRVGGGRKSR